MTMGSGTLVLFISQILICIVDLTISQADYRGSRCTDMGNETINNMYRSNLNDVLSSISINITPQGFYNSSAGKNSEKVYALALCRGDVGPDECRSCLNNSTPKLRHDCPTQKEAVGWNNNCMLRYSNRSLFQIMDTSPVFTVSNTANFTNASQFNQILRGLLDNLTGEASSGGPLRKFASGSVSAPDFSTMYALAQCTPDLSDMQCTDCLVRAAGDIPGCCNGKQGAVIFTPSCNLRYELYRFYNKTEVFVPPPQSVLPPSQPPLLRPPEGKHDKSTPSVVIIVVTTVIPVLILVGICIYIFVKKKTARKPKGNISASEDIDEISSEESLQFDFGKVEVATDYFSDSNKLGQGGFGTVYKGRLQNGQEIAVKRLSRGYGQGDLEFKNEVLLVAKLQHRNLVRLLGFCLEGIERILIYEFLPNASLDQFIFDPIKRSSLDWDRRFKIIGGVARGLLYLHEDSRLRIIHRDLKASNVLLDTEMNSKISDFGMARLFKLDETRGNTNRIVGTYGYMAPEYAIYGQFSAKSDVFSFGILVLEIIIGRKNGCLRNGKDVEDITSYAWKKWHEVEVENMIDSTLRIRSGSIREMMRCIHIGLLCVQEHVTDRPTMSAVAFMLNSNSLTLPVPSKPALFMHSTISTDTISTEMTTLEEQNSEDE